MPNSPSPQRAHALLESLSADETQRTLDRLNLIGLTLGNDGTLLYANPYTLRVTAWTAEQVIGQNFFETMLPDADKERLRHDFTNLLLRGKLPDIREIGLLTGSGAVRNVVMNSVLPSQPGEPAGITLVGEDVTSKRRVASALSNISAQLQDLIDNTSDLIQLLTLEGRFIFVNRAWCEVLGYTSSEVVSLSLLDVLHPDAADSTLRQLERIKNGEHIPYFETVFRNKAGKTIFLSGSVNCRFDNGRPTSFRCILHDTTARNRAERAQKLYFGIANWTISTPNLNDFYQKIHDELSNIIDARNFFIALYDVSKTYLSFPYYVDEYLGGHMRFTKRKLGNGLTEYTIRANKPLVLYKNDIRQLAHDHKIDLYGQIIPEVMLTAPLRIGDEITGIIGVKSYHDAHTYGPRDLELLEFISGQVAMAIARKQAEITLDKQNARLNAIFDSSTYLIWSVNRSLQLTSFNKNYVQFIENISRVTPILMANTVRAGWRMMGDDANRTMEDHYRQAFRGMPQNFELPIWVEKQGEIFLEIHLNPILLAGGVIEEVSGIGRDITNRKRAEITTRQSEEKFRGIFENLQDIYVRVDRKGHITMVSPSIYKRLGYLPDEVMGQDATRFFVDKQVLRQAVIKLVRNHSLRNFEVALYRKDGTERQFMFNMLLLQDEQGQYSVVAVLARDITELKRQAAELVHARDEAQRSLKVKEQFLANMSHEIRTPMNGVIGMVDLLADTQLDDEQRSYVRTIKRSSETLLNILNDILDLSKIEAGKMVLHETPLDFREVFEKLIALFGQQAHSKNNALSYHLDPELPKYVIADQTRLLQILSNLTSNAIKFTENGIISIQTQLISKRGKFNRIRVSVHDSGIGISPSDLNLLFTNFSQVDTSSRKSFGGTGLGLAISRQLAQLMKGDVGVESEVGKGSTFWFEIEVKETSISPAQQSTEAPEMVLTNFFNTYHPDVLLVDDNAVNRKVASEIMRKAGCVVATAASGAEAIELVSERFEAVEAGKANPFDVIFMDIQMPDMDGIETTARLRKLFGNKLPSVVAMTAYSMREDRERFLSQGMDDYVAKPIRAQSLIAKVKELTEAFRKPKTQNPDTAAAPKPQPTVAIETGLPVLDDDIVAQLRQIGGDDLVNSVMDDFVTEATQLVEEAASAYEQGDIPTVKSHLHTLKGSAGTVGVARVADIARTAEAKLKVADTSGLGEAIQALQTAFADFLNHWAAKT